MPLFAVYLDNELYDQVIKIKSGERSKLVQQLLRDYFNTSK